MKTTKELAKELGLLRRRTIASSKDVQRGEKSSGQDFKYLIVIDFESTCWKEGKFRTQEIIEFPAVLLNTDTGEVESEFHYYVQPQEQPILSSFCTELTGITQEQVNDGIPLNFCLRKFRYWLDKLCSDKGVICTGASVIKTQQATSNTTCVTWSDWDLGVCLQYECKRKQLLKPPELTSWIDLRATYRKFYQRKPNGLNGALQDVGISFQGREHSGVDDARNTAKLAYRLIKDGCQLKVTKTLKNHERSSSCNPSIGSYFKPESAKQATGVTALKPGKDISNTDNMSTKQDTYGNSLKPETGSLRPGSNSSKPDTISSIQQANQSKPETCINISKPLPNSPEQLKSLPNKQTPSKIPRPIRREVTTPNDTRPISRERTTPNETRSISQEGTTPNKPRPISREVVTPNDSLGVVPFRRIALEIGNNVIMVENRQGINNKSSFTKNSLTEKRKTMTPVKQKLSGKRKEITPLKLKDKCTAANSPLRKAPRKFTPKKAPVREVYVDKCSETNASTEGKPDTIVKQGLKERNTNIVSQCQEPGISKKTSQSNDNCSKNEKDVFKKPSPVSGRMIKMSSPKTTRENGKNFCASTPVGNSTAPKPFFCKDIVSPITNQNGSKASNNNIINKTSTPFGQGKSSINSTASTPFGSTLSYRTPTSSYTSGSYQQSFLNGSNPSSMKMTPPLCKCGRRSTRKMVQSPGPNMGRFFFSCTVRKGAWSKDGCDFFKWEVAAASTPKVNSYTSKNGSSISRQFTPVLNMRTPNTANNLQKRNLGVRTAFKTPMCIR